MTKQEFKIIFDQYFDSIRNFVYYKSSDKELASDVAQEVFMKIWENRNHYHNTNIKSLLYKMANENFISKYRKIKSEQKYQNQYEFDYSHSTTEQDVNYKELEKKYQLALSEMNPNNSEVFLMSRVEDLKYAEIADRLQLSIKAVEKRMKNALEFLRTKLKD